MSSGQAMHPKLGSGGGRGPHVAAHEAPVGHGGQPSGLSQRRGVQLIMQRPPLGKHCGLAVPVSGEGAVDVVVAVERDTVVPRRTLRLIDDLRTDQVLLTRVVAERTVSIHRRGLDEAVGFPQTAARGQQHEQHPAIPAHLPRV